MIPGKKRHFIYRHFSIREVLATLNDLVPDSIAFLVDDQDRLIGSVTDGDMRRGFINGLDFNTSIEKFIQPDPHRLTVNESTPQNYKRLKALRIKIVPIVNELNEIIDIINIDKYKSLLPLEAIIMAGGKGERLMPLTKDTPKPLLKVGEKPIIEHTVDRLIEFGVKDIHISINYLGHMIRDYFGDGSDKGISIKYIQEEKALGTIGSVALADGFQRDELLIMNSDLLTNVNYNDFYEEFSGSGADMSVATVPHHVDLPYAIMELDENRVISLHEKPRYTYFANAGIYMIKSGILDYIPKNSFFNATDLMETVIREGKRLVSYPIWEYWLDIGRSPDYQKAQEDIKHVKF